MSPRHRSALDARRLKAACSTCSLRELCLPAGLDEHEVEKIDRMVSRRKMVRRGDCLYRSGAALDSLYAVRTGFMKSCVLHEDGREQVAGFHMMGDVMGLEAISSGRHMCDVMALEDSEVCEIPLAQLQRLSRDIPSLQQHFHRIMSREIVHDHGVMLLLGSMRAEERLAVFLLNLSQRFAARGYSASEFYLRMKRDEIGSYLGLQLETISRTLSRLHEQRVIEVRTRHVKILDMDALREMIGLRALRD